MAKESERTCDVALGSSATARAVNHWIRSILCRRSPEWGVLCRLRKDPREGVRMQDWNDLICNVGASVEWMILGTCSHFTTRQRFFQSCGLSFIDFFPPPTPAGSEVPGWRVCSKQHGQWILQD
ncbi:unnamed protein product [Ostreobium quekettii]|uniref:Uncharacterized protein n=1 Tax=Ostreobium quekettii TaxID=121088 RepID=A0A8S1IPQ7_9CHLO|nr:unnamed protein product [Ostreobium quekettii]|eukprot:evm.model.scf_409.3 EVM.evm.TU.scf_409.3   scf_409:19426-19797(+)